MIRRTHGTSGGVELTDELIERLADEAERGYEDEQLRPRGRGRPLIGQSPATVFQVRLPPAMRDELSRVADASGTTASDVVRQALRAYFDAEAASAS